MTLWDTALIQILMHKKNGRPSKVAAAHRTVARHDLSIQKLDTATDQPFGPVQAHGTQLQKKSVTAWGDCRAS